MINAPHSFPAIMVVGHPEDLIESLYYLVNSEEDVRTALLTVILTGYNNNQYADLYVGENVHPDERLSAWEREALDLTKEQLVERGEEIFTWAVDFRRRHQVEIADYEEEEYQRRTLSLIAKTYKEQGMVAARDLLVERDNFDFKYLVDEFISIRAEMDGDEECSFLYPAKTIDEFDPDNTYIR